MDGHGNIDQGETEALVVEEVLEHKRRSRLPPVHRANKVRKVDGVFRQTTDQSV